jgi:hypothetical protein
MMKSRSEARGMIDGLHAWARRRAQSMAAEYLRDRADMEGPDAFFEAAISGEKLLSTMRSIAEAEFHERIREIEVDAHG